MEIFEFCIDVVTYFEPRKWTKVNDDDQELAANMTILDAKLRACAC